MAQRNITERTYQLGRIIFSITNCDPTLEKELELFVPICNKNDAEPIIFDAKIHSIKNVLDLINLIHKQHQGTFWILGASIVSPTGITLLLSGFPSSGKSTIALALALGFGWKIVSEDITHIDMNTDELINFASPFAIRPRTFEVLKEVLTSELSSSSPQSWMALGSANIGHHIAARFDLVVDLDSSRTTKFICEKISQIEYAKMLLQKSNIARMSGAAIKVCDYLADGGCYRITGGSVTERLEAITRLSLQCDNNKRGRTL